MIEFEKNSYHVIDTIDHIDQEFVILRPSSASNSAGNVPDPEAEELSSDGASEDNENLAANALAQEQRKKAGIPELPHDALPSSLAIKMMILGLKS